MVVSALGGRTQATVQQLVEMRRQLDDLQRQLATGRKASNYADLGAASGLTIALRSQLATLSGFDQTMQTVGIRLELAQTALTRIGEIGSATKASLLQDFTIGSDGQAQAQRNARSRLDELLDLLNTQVDGRYLFSGRTVDGPAVASGAEIIEGDGARAGLRQVIDERRQADLGADGLGRLVLDAVGNTVSLAEDAAASPFGFKLAAASTDIAGATVAGPAGTPPSLSIDFGAATPQPGQTVTLTLSLPDGTTETLRLTATASTSPAAGEFAIGASAGATAANFRAALDTSLHALAGTRLVAASAMAAGAEFFALDATQVPQRVAGPPFATATALTAATPSDTMFWYTGEIAPDAPRGAASARIDAGIAVNYGMRANEEALRTLVQNVAVLAATSFAPTDPQARDAYAALADRLRPALDGAPSVQTVQEIASDIAAAQSAIKSAEERHRQSQGVLAGLLDETQGISNEEVVAQILSVQTRLQASLQATAILYQLNLVDYL
ncbi:MAG TPA: flagellar biosynthesis protein FlgL [Xanthobacteraceae bacterium]|nr:flagellar biosynthesis protein FlgL [Xanthobacteraceae bacterium]